MTDIETKKDKITENGGCVRFGWKLVPTEPTSEMRAEGQQVLRSCGHGAVTMSDLWPVYRAMLAAAPEAPAQQEADEVIESSGCVFRDLGLPAPAPVRVKPLEWITSAIAALEAYEADLGERLPDQVEIGRIDESRGSASFRIRVGHIRALATAVTLPAPATDALAAARAEGVREATELAELVLSMGMSTDAGQHARHLARRVLGIPDPNHTGVDVVAITTNGTTRLIPRDEPVFLLRGQDVYAAETVRYWADAVEGNTKQSPGITSIAREQADKMDAWPVKKVPDHPATLSLLKEDK